MNEPREKSMEKVKKGVHCGLKLQKLCEKSTQCISKSSECDLFFRILENDTPI